MKTVSETEILGVLDQFFNPSRFQIWFLVILNIPIAERELSCMFQLFMS